MGADRRAPDQVSAPQGEIFRFPLNLEIEKPRRELVGSDNLRRSFSTLHEKEGQGSRAVQKGTQVTVHATG
eukprot:1576989-Rhodomonas_salina.2